MSKDTYPSIFLHQMEAIASFILQIFFVSRAVLKTGEYINNSTVYVIFTMFGYLFTVSPISTTVLNTLTLK